MSREQANAFKKHRDAEDAQGNLGWAARMQAKALRCGPEALQRLDVEGEFELSPPERVLWRIMRIPRKYMDLEHANVLPTDKLRGFLRGLVAADVLDIVDASEGKALIPAEIRRVRADIEGKAMSTPAQPLKARVYRPDISGTPPVTDAPPQHTPAAGTTAPPVQHTPATGTGSPAAHTPARPTVAPQTTPARPTPSISSFSDEERALKAEIDRAYERMQKQNHYDFLGVTKTADDSGVRSAYMHLARELHPDRISGTALASDETTVARIDALFKRLQEAQAAIGTGEARATYNRTLEALGAGGATAAGGKQRRPLEAQNALRMGDAFFKRREYKQAEAHYRQAANFDPEEPKILTALAYCVWLNPDHEESVRTAEARKRLTEVINKYKHGDAAYKLALVLRKIGDDAGAQRNIQLAVRLDPDHLEATREMRLFSMRKEEKKAEEKSLLGKFLKK